MIKYKVLLDLDDTALIYSDTTHEYVEHPKLLDMLTQFDVILFSGRTDIQDFAIKWDVPFISKDEDVNPTADFLVDDSCERWIKYVKVKKGYESIDSFLSSVGSKY